MASFGSWPTPVTSELVVRAAAGLGDVRIHGDTVVWSEQRPEENGRTQLVRRTGAGSAVDLLPPGFNARTAVHEYGGGAWWLAGDSVWFANWADQRLHVLDGAGVPVAVTPDPDVPRGDRWADGCVTADGRWVLVVREHHPVDGSPADVVNDIVVLDTTQKLPPRVLIHGPDFVSDPRLSAAGDQLCWLQWSHPDMPWDGTELHVATLRDSDAGPLLGTTVVVAGRRGEESVGQPRWADDGNLWFISDRSDWWNLYRWDPAADRVEAMVTTGAEIGGPQWVFGQSSHAFLSGGRTVFATARDGIGYLAIRLADGRVLDLDLPYTSFASIQAEGDRVVFVGASATAEPAVVSAIVDEAGVVTELEVLRAPRDLGLDPAWFSRPEPISFPTSGGRTAHALFYPPTNPDVRADPDGLPPLLVVIHGGPTSAARPVLQLAIQYWTSRGFAVTDVNYGGSTGYGRA